MTAYLYTKGYDRSQFRRGMSATNLVEGGHIGCFGDPLRAAWVGCRVTQNRIGAFFVEVPMCEHPAQAALDAFYARGIRWPGSNPYLWPQLIESEVLCIADNDNRSNLSCMMNAAHFEALSRGLRLADSPYVPATDNNLGLLYPPDAFGRLSELYPRHYVAHCVWFHLYWYWDQLAQVWVTKRPEFFREGSWSQGWLFENQNGKWGRTHGFYVSLPQAGGYRWVDGSQPREYADLVERARPEPPTWPRRRRS